MSTIKLFESKKIRSVWNAEKEKWYFSIVDVVEILTDSPNPRKYWSVLKTRLKKENSQLTTNCSQLKMKSDDGKFYKTDVADTEQLFRLKHSYYSCNVAKVARKELEAKTGKKVVTSLNAKSYLGLKTAKGDKND